MSGLLGACSTSRPTPPEMPATPFEVKIVAFNDYHGQLRSPGRFGSSLRAPENRPPVGGAEYLAAEVAELKASNALNVVVGAGDLVGASPLVSAAFQDEPAIETLNRIGLEFSAVGNHEFDRGQAELKRLQQGGCKTRNGAQDPHSCRGAEAGTPVPFEGARFRYLAANVRDTRTGEPFFTPYGIKTFRGVPIAFIGMTLKETPSIVAPGGVEGLRFLDEAETVDRLVPEIASLGIHAIVVLVHQGGVQTDGGQDINGCDGGLAGSAIADIVSRLDDAVDLVVSGHTHAAYNCRLPNRAGRAIPVTSAGAYGRLVTDIVVTLDPASRDIVAVRATNRLVDRTNAAIVPDDEVGRIVDRYEALVSPIADTVIGSITRTLPADAADAACNMPAGELIADAQLESTARPGSGEARIAFMNRGGVRSPGFLHPQSNSEGDGNVTYGEGFAVQPFGNRLVTMTLTAREIKAVLEEQFAGCRGQAPTATRILLPSAGFRYVWDASKPCDARISAVTLARGAEAETLVDANGLLPDPAKSYRVTVNDFLSAGGDGFTTFRQGKDRLVGTSDIDALVGYLAAFKAPNAAYDPNDAALGKPRIVRRGGTRCPTGADANP